VNGNPRIVGIEWARLAGQRPRPAGSNARLGPHGSLVPVPLVRLTTDDGCAGFGIGEPGQDLASTMLGRRLDEVFATGQGVLEPWLPLEVALWDLVGKQAGLPVYALAAAFAGMPPPRPFRVLCYDTSLYFDDLHLATDREAADLIAREAREGYLRGHRAFKIKVGRGARHLPVAEGTRRDIAVVRAVREAVGPECTLLLDANDGYTLNLAKQVLAATAECSVFWLEEPFREDGVLYRDLRNWLAQQNLPVLIADGEGEASPRLLEWAREHLVDVVQNDILEHGFTRWLSTGRQLDAWGVRSAPHHYGAYYGNYVACHLAGAIRSFAYVEWDEASVAGLDASGYTMAEGRVGVPDAPGFGLTLDDGVFRHAVAAVGFRRTVS
jgi:L-alanine-DL-glutamate epimerase-like enolase superfamily enzyme